MNWLPSLSSNQIWMQRLKLDWTEVHRIVEMFKQTAFNPIPVEIQTAIMWGMQNDFFDSIDVDQISNAVSSLKDYLSTQGKDVCNEIYQSGKLEESTEQNLRTALEDWKRTFA